MRGSNRGKHLMPTSGFHIQMHRKAHIHASMHTPIKKGGREGRGRERKEGKGCLSLGMLFTSFKTGSLTGLEFTNQARLSDQ